MARKRQHIAYVAVLVRDYEEAKAYYCGVLGFKLIEDTALPDGKRWVLVAPPGSRETRLLLARAATPAWLLFSKICTAIAGTCCS